MVDRPGCWYHRRSRPALRARARHLKTQHHKTQHREVRTLAKTPRTWTGARTPSGLKRVRSAERRHAVLGPRRSTAKTLVKNALIAATSPSEDNDPQVALTAAISALDRAAKAGAIHPNAAARRKSRLVRKVNAAGFGSAAASSHVAKTIGRAAAQKAAKARIAASKADKAKGAQTAAGKARAALSKSSRAEAAAAKAAKAPAAEAKAAPKAPTKRATKAATKPATKAATKAAAKPKAAAKKAPAKKASKA
jgi:ribosomal protein S20